MKTNPGGMIRHLKSFHSSLPQMFVPISYFHIFRQSLKTLRHIYFTRAAVIQLRHFPIIQKAAARTASIIGLCPSFYIKKK